MNDHRTTWTRQTYYEYLLVQFCLSWIPLPPQGLYSTPSVIRLAWPACYSQGSARRRSAWRYIVSSPHIWMPTHLSLMEYGMQDGRQHKFKSSVKSKLINVTPFIFHLQSRLMDFSLRLQKTHGIGFVCSLSSNNSRELLCTLFLRSALSHESA